MIKEADMRLSSDVSMCWDDRKHIFDFIIRRNQTSGHRKVGCAVGNPRLVNSAWLRSKPEKELWLVTTGWLSGIWPARMGRRLNERARSTLLSFRANGCVIVRIFFRETGELMNISSWMWNIIPMSVAKWKKWTFNNTCKIRTCGLAYYLNCPFSHWRRVLAP